MMRSNNYINLTVLETVGRRAEAPSLGRYPSSPVANRFLARLPVSARDEVAAQLRSVDLSPGAVLYEARGRIEAVYFPAGAVISALTVMNNGDTVEVVTIGNEGVVGHTAVLGGGISPDRVIVQVGGPGLRVASAPLRVLAAAGGPLRGMLEAYDDAYRVQVSRAVACNALHRLEPRCCRWLLMTLDRVATNHLKLSHDYLAAMLGARRASVTAVLRPLQEAELVRSEHGRIIILDRAGLELRSCECYRVIRDEFDRLYG